MKQTYYREPRFCLDHAKGSWRFLDRHALHFTQLVFISCERQGTDGVVFKTHPKNISNPRSKLLKKCGHGRIFTYFF